LQRLRRKVRLKNSQRADSALFTLKGTSRNADLYG
jgi:hypothetical protein